MKTFDEAASLFCLRSGWSYGKRAAEREAELESRFREMREDIMASEKYTSLIVDCLRLIAQGLTLYEAIGVAFIRGICIGIEMEKREP